MARVKRVIWTLEVTKDLEEIFSFIAEKSPVSASRTIETIIEAAENLRFSEQYQADEYNPKYRRLIVSHYKLVYKILNDELVILRAFDTRIDPSRQEVN